MFHGRLPPQVFAKLVTPHLHALHRLAFRFTRQQSDAEDLLQELLTRLYARSERLTRIESLRPWLARALYNLYVDEHRRRARSPLGRLQEPAAGAGQENSPAQAVHSVDPDRSLEMELLQQHLGQVMAQLPEEQRLVVILHDVEGYELHETAEILRVALGTIKSRLHRAHERLRKLLRQRNLIPSNVVLSNESPGLEAAISSIEVADDEV
jgi:RNA polymerase sigma-70 factor (ECF subfamily)